MPSPQPPRSDSASSGFIYLDHNATTRPLPEVVEAVARMERDLWGNPSSVHRFGQQVRQQVELAREQVGRLVGAEPAEIVFTASGTESTNLAIFGTLRRLAQHQKLREQPRQVILTTTVEHSAVAEPLDSLSQHEAGWKVERIHVERSGLIRLNEYERALETHKGRIALISLLWANNETGVIQPLAQLAQLAKASDPRIIFHTDAVQCVGKMPVDLRREALRGVDLLSLAGHKFHGPKGIGALYVRRGVRIAPMTLGGPHERKRRGGTESAPQIVGLGVAAQHAMQLLAQAPDDPKSRIAAARTRRDRLEETILKRIASASINGERTQRLWNTSNIAFDRLEAEAILLLLSERGVCASAGAACSSGSLDPSPILLAMGIEPTRAHGSIRLSIDENTTDEEIDRAVEVIVQVDERLRHVLPVGT